LAGIDTSGALTSWLAPANSAAYVVYANGSSVYAGGAFTTIGNCSRTNFGLIDKTTGLSSPSTF
jgi:hypothetical protein